MESSGTANDEPLTPMGRMFLSPKTSQIMNVGMGLKYPVTTDFIVALKADLANSVLAKHPRFSSLLFVDRGGTECWRRTRINFDDHIIVHRHFSAATATTATELEMEEIINDYASDFALSTLSTDKPLWEVHVMTDLKCLIWRIHHALIDGMSLMSLFQAISRRVDDANKIPTMEAVVVSGGDGRNNGGRPKKKGVWGFLRVIWFTIIFMLELIGRISWVRDKRTVISGGDGVELWPRKVATARFCLEDMKIVKRSIPNGTINDVLIGVISCGLSKYLEARSTNALQEGLKITSLAMVSLREQLILQEILDPGRRSNKFGTILLPVYYHRTSNADDLLTYVKRAKLILDRKKESLEAHFTYFTNKLVVTCFGVKAISFLCRRLFCNTTFTISNIVGPKEEIVLAGNSINYLRISVSSTPQAIVMHMVSYQERADMQILVVKDIIPDPEFLAECFQDALLQLKDAAQGKQFKADL